MTKEQISPKMRDILEDNMYFDYRIIPGRGIVALLRFAFTVGLVYGIDEHCYDGRYCFNTAANAREALNLWDEVILPVNGSSIRA